MSSVAAPRPAAAFGHRHAPRLFCIGRNYAKHIAELDHGPDAQQCVVFMKPPSALVAPGETIPLPTGVGAVHHEAELVVEIGLGGTHIAADRARAHIGASEPATARRAVVHGLSVGYARRGDAGHNCGRREHAPHEPTQGIVILCPLDEYRCRD